jgi:hypothetical protein
VIACYVHDSANREFDLVDAKGDTAAAGSDALLIGNVIVKAPHCSGNRAVIHFGQDGGGEHDGTLYLVHNTIVSPFISPIVQLSAAKARAQLYNNIVWDGAAVQNGQVLIDVEKDAAKAEAVKGTCNWLSSGFRGAALAALPLQQSYFGNPGHVMPFVDPAKGNYRLSKADPTIVEKGCVLSGDALHATDGKLLQYKPPQGAESRLIESKPDLGAYEFTPRRP